MTNSSAGDARAHTLRRSAVRLGAVAVLILSAACTPRDGSAVSPARPPNQHSHPVIDGTARSSHGSGGGDGLGILVHVE
jgi:hypothetical protein